MSLLFINEVIDYLETKWQRKLTEHERAVVIEGYRFGRLTEMRERDTHFGGEMMNDFQKGCWVGRNRIGGNCYSVICSGIYCSANTEIYEQEEVKHIGDDKP
jgi:hypothetical protein